MHPDLHTDLDNLDTVENNLRNSAKVSLDTYDVTVSLTNTAQKAPKAVQTFWKVKSGKWGVQRSAAKSSSKSSTQPVTKESEAATTTQKAQTTAKAAKEAPKAATAAAQA